MDENTNNSAAPAADVVNPLLTVLKARLPGETFRLPSQGLFYTHGELSDDVVNGEVHVFPLTALDEILLKTPDKLLSGKAITEVFSHCIPQIKQPLQLLSKDVDYLLMCLRLITYGENIEMSYNHKCLGEDGCDSTEHQYSVAARPILAKAKQIDPTTITSTFELVLPSEQRIKMRPPLYGDVLALYLSNFELKNLDSDERFYESQRQLVNVISSAIYSVDNVTNPEFIKEWVAQLPAGWMTLIGQSTQKVGDWGIETDFTTTCKDCGKNITISIPLNPISFFS